MYHSRLIQHASTASIATVEGWINYIWDALVDEEDRAVARRIIERFVAKIVIKEQVRSTTRSRSSMIRICLVYVTWT